MKPFTHVQSTPSMEWVVTHNLKSHPVSDVTVTLDGAVVRTMPYSLVYLDENSVAVHFSEPQAGTIRLIG